MTILVAFHQSSYRTFKDYYQKQVCLYWRWTFAKLVMDAVFGERNFRHEIVWCCWGGGIPSCTYCCLLTRGQARQRTLFET